MESLGSSRDQIPLQGGRRGSMQSTARDPSLVRFADRWLDDIRWEVNNRKGFWRPDIGDIQGNETGGPGYE